MFEAVSGNDLQWLTIFLVVLCFYFLDRSRVKFWNDMNRQLGNISNDMHLRLEDINRDLQKLKENIDNIAHCVTETRNRDLHRLEEKIDNMGRK